MHKGGASNSPNLETDLPLELTLQMMDDINNL